MFISFVIYNIAENSTCYHRVPTGTILLYEEPNELPACWHRGLISDKEPFHFTSVGVVLHKAKSTLLPGKKSPQSQVKGTVEMIQTVRGVKFATFFKVEISGLPSNSVHGFHIHKYGDIITAGCSSTGGHYNPFNKTHGAPYDKIRHVGDLGNLYADENGNVKVIKRDYLVSLVGKDNVLGRAFVLHALKDDLGRGGDLGSKTTGNAGARIACGVIVRAAESKRS